MNKKWIAKIYRIENEWFGYDRVPRPIPFIREPSDCTVSLQREIPVFPAL